MAGEFKDRAVLITGAGSGIGRELAKRLTAEGARVGGLDREKSSLQELEGKLPKGSFNWVTADVTQTLGLNQAIAELVGKQGPVDVLIACAGIGHETRGSTWNAGEFENMLRINLIGVSNSIGAVLPGMLERRRGHLVGLSSLASICGLPSMAAYCASKAGLNALLQSLRIELAPYGIAVSTICPGFISTPMTVDLQKGGMSMMTLDYAVDRILEGIRTRRKFLAFPRKDARLLGIIRQLPAALGDRLLRTRMKRVDSLINQKRAADAAQETASKR